MDPGLLATLVDDPDIWVRSELDHKHNAPPEVLTRLGADPEVAGNDVTPAGVLVGLADDPDPKVREQVAGNGATPSPVVVRLADNPQTWEAHGFAPSSSAGQRVAHMMAIDAAFKPRPPARVIESLGMGTTNGHTRREDER